MYKHRLKSAKFPFKKYLEDLDRKELPSNVIQELKELETLDFIRNGQNVILLGNPGVGKTHIAIGLGIRACLNNMSVLYITVHNLITELKESVSLNQLSNYNKKIIKYDLV
ncbi:MAG: ATP-binding protein, partial [Bacilli bacterium]|nr:ATP-binding protein [Bacilli bacterium]